MNAKTSSEGEEEASGTRNETLGKSGYLGEAKRGQVIRVAYVIAALDLTFLFMQMGVMPYLAKSLGLDSVGFGYLQTIFGVLQLVGGYIFGRFADQFGARAALILSCASGSVFFLLMSLSTSIPLLFLSRLPGMFMHGIPGAQKVITDMTTPSQRAGALGKLGLCFGVGIIAGSALGGVLSTKLGGLFPLHPAEGSSGSLFLPGSRAARRSGFGAALQSYLRQDWGKQPARQQHLFHSVRICASPWKDDRRFY